MLSSIAVARALGQERFGALGIVTGTVAAFQGFAGVGLAATATKYIAEYRHSDPARTGRILALSETVGIASGVILGGLLLLFAPEIASRALADPGVAPMLRISSIAVLFGAMNGAQGGAIVGFQAFRTMAAANLAVGVVTVPLMVGGALLDGVEGAVWGFSASFVVSWLVNNYAVDRLAREGRIPRTFRGASHEFRILWAFSVPAVLSAILIAPVNWACSALLVNEPGGYAQMGLFNAANQWFGAMIFIPGVVAQVILPALAERMGKNEHANARRVMFGAMGVNVVVTVPLVVIGVLMARQVMSLYGAAFVAGSATLAAVLVAGALVAVQGPLAQAIAASGKMWVLAAMNAGWACATLALTVALLRFGSTGLALARLGGYAIHMVWMVPLALRALRGTPEPRSDTNPGLAATTGHGAKSM